MFGAFLLNNGGCFYERFLQEVKWTRRFLLELLGAEPNRADVI